MSWGISENASEKEKLKAEVNDYFHGLNAVGKIDYIGYSKLYDACMPILEECYDRMEKEQEVESEQDDDIEALLEHLWNATVEDMRRNE